MPFEKGNTLSVGNGRPVGALAKINVEIKDMIRQALDECGGAAYLKAQAIKNPVAFMGLIGKVIPKDVNVTIKEMPEARVYPQGLPYAETIDNEQVGLSITSEAMDSLH